MIGYPDPARLVELSQSGRLVWEMPAQGTVSGIQVLFPRLRLGFDDLPERPDLKTSIVARRSMLQSQDPERRILAARSIRDDFRQAGLPLVPDLFATLAVGEALRTRPGPNRWSEVVRFTQEAIRACGPNWPAATRDALKSANPLVRAGAIFLVGRDSRDGGFFTKEDFLQFARTMTNDPDSDARRAAIVTIGWHPGLDNDLFPILTSSLQDTDSPSSGGLPVACAAAESLWRWAEAGAPRPGQIQSALEALTRTSKVKNPDLTQACFEALGRIGALSDELAASTIPALAASLRDKKTPTSRYAATRAVAMLKHRAKPLLPDLLDAIKSNPDPALTVALIRAIGAIGPKAEEAVPVLAALLMAAKTPEDQLEVVHAITSVGPKAKSTLPLLQKLLDEFDAEPINDTRVRLRASLMESIRRIDR